MAAGFRLPCSRHRRLAVVDADSKRDQLSQVVPKPAVGMGGSVLSLATLVDADLQLSQRREDVVERCGLGEIHVQHRLVITLQRRQPLGRGDETKCFGLRMVVVRPRTSEELALPAHGLVLLRPIVIRFVRQQRA
jgi:hypothetical protein